MEIREIFAQSVEAKCKTLAGFSSLPALNTLFHALKKTEQKGRTIYIAGDEVSKFSADHLAEEFQVRYQSGTPFGREDRPAVSAISLTEYDLDVLPSLMGRLQSDDCIVVFAESAQNKSLEKMVVEGVQRNVRCVVVCDAGNSGLAALGDIGAHILPIAGTPSTGARFSIQRAILHGICEGFEPEFSGDSRQTLCATLEESIALDRRILASDTFLDDTTRIRSSFIERINAGGAVFLFGNGGSACDAQELAAALRCCRDLNGTPVIVGTFLQAGYLTCAVNDGYEVFQRGIEGIRGENNVILAFSTSGASKNVNQAVKLAREKGILTIALTGKDGGALASMAEMSIIVPSQTTARIQEAHALIGFFLTSGLT